MASGSVTKRFLFSTSFLSLEHLWDQSSREDGASGTSFRDTQRPHRDTQRPVYHHTASMSPLVTEPIRLWAVPYLHRLSGMSSRLLLAAMNSSRLTSLPMPEGIPSKSSLLEFRYIFFSLVSLQMADWGRRRWWGEGEPRPRRHGKGWRGWAGTYGQGGELVAGQVEGLQLGPLVDAEGQLCDLVAAEVETPQAAQGVEALGDATEVVAGQVHVWGRIMG